MVWTELLHGFVYTTVQVLKAIKIYLQTLLLSDLLYIFAEDSLHLGKTFKQAWCYALGLHYPCTMYYMLKVKNMEQQILQFNQAQLQLLDMMSFVKTPEALSDLNKVISDYFVKKADEEMEKMWNEGTLNKEKIENFRTLHERTPYNKPLL